MRRLAVAMVLVLAGCGGESNPTPSAIDAEFITMPGDHVFAMIVPAGTPADSLPLMAKDKCGPAGFCRIHAWNDRVSAARALPMTDKEMDSQVFSYVVNRGTGFERITWNCAIYPDKRKASDQCI